MGRVIYNIIELLSLFERANELDIVTHIHL